MRVNGWARPHGAAERMLRIGCVKYLNARPLINGWPGEVEFDHPSALCQRLANGELDVALVSSFEFLRNPIYQIVDDISISSDGPVYSVIVSHCNELSSIEEIQLDPASQTSVNLLRCLLAELGLKPRFVSKTLGRTGFQPVASAGLSEMSSAQLLIGDQAIQFRRKYAGEMQFWDLGEQWKKVVGLPFVYALWLIRPEIPNARTIAQRLRKLRDENLANLDDLVTQSLAGIGASAVALAKADEPGNREITREFLTRYYSEYIRFSFGEREKQGLQRFASLCAKHGLLPKHDPVLRVV